MEISKQASSIPASPIRKLAALAQEKEDSGITVYHVNFGQPDLETPEEFFNTLTHDQHKIVSYAPSHGVAETIDAWRQYLSSYNITFTNKEIVVTTGSSEAILFTLHTVADEGDHILIFEPTYPGYIINAHMRGVKLVPVALHSENGFHLPDEKEITKAITKKTKAIVFCNPANPTGTVYSREEVGVIARIAEKHDLFIISDETYREIVFSGEPAVSMMHFPEVRDRVILIDSVSKRFNACGARIGCLASKNPDVIKSVTQYAMGRLSAPLLEQHAVIPLLTNSEPHVRPLIEKYRERRDAIIEGLKEIPGVKHYTPEGAFYIMATLPVKDIEDFSRWLLEEFTYENETVMLAPACGFYISKGKGANETRIAYVLEADKLRRAMEVLKIALEQYTKQYGKKVA
ncbi:pyridoxal phosphate-dependent aminotransferase [Patescibacteria group bacterium]